MTDDDFEAELDVPIRDLEFDAPKRHDEGHIARIADSIALNGMLNPVIVHRISAQDETTPRKYRVDAGEGRIHAHILLKKKTIRVRVYRHDPLRSRLRHIDENIARVEVDSYEWDRLVTERIEIVKQLDPKNRVIKEAQRPSKPKKPPCVDPDKMHGAADEFGGSDFPELSNSAVLETTPNANFAFEGTKPNAVEEVAKELKCSPRKVAQAKARVQRAAPAVAAAHASAELKTCQVDEIIKIKDPEVQTEVVAQVVGKTYEETKEIVAAVGKPPDARLDSEMQSAIKLARALTTRLQTIKRLTEVKGLTPSDVVRAQYCDLVLGLKQWL